MEVKVINIIPVAAVKQLATITDEALENAAASAAAAANSATSAANSATTAGEALITIETTISTAISEATTAAENSAIAAANSASNAEVSAALAQGAEATAWDVSTTYNYPTVVAYTDGYTYRCIGTSVLGDIPPNSANWVKAAWVENDFFEIDINGDLTPSGSPIYSADFELDGNNDIQPKA